jgi:mannose-6-phosphate isomerase-like protein (cupin superfamily)
MMCKVIGLAILAAIATLPSQASAQSLTVDHYSRSELLEQAKLLDQGASATGSAGTKLAQYPNHFTMLTLRKKSGGAEIHRDYADIFVVVSGQATLVSGGTVVAPKVSGPGETQGASVQGGASIPLHKGDVVHIPAGLPHQLVLPVDGELVYFVVKVREPSPSQ